ncbi:50S ribosomal protein L23 [Candidatus Woesearchaeota archaeon]|nr:MAG: 50S ribosomal protein L23 [Candidatus Woesearchaeota archaeon]
MKDPYQVITFPVATEKAVRLMEAENKLTLMVNRKSTKPEIKDAVEKVFKVKVKKVNTMITPSGKKKAYVLLSEETPARDVATQLGLL